MSRVPAALTHQQRGVLVAETMCSAATVASVYAGKPTKPASHARVLAAAQKYGYPLPPPYVREVRDAPAAR